MRADHIRDDHEEQQRDTDHDGYSDAYVMISKEVAQDDHPCDGRTNDQARRPNDFPQALVSAEDAVDVGFDRHAKKPLSEATRVK